MGEADNLPGDIQCPQSVNCRLQISSPRTLLIIFITKARSIEVELIPACQRYGLDVVIYNPLAGGLFSGKIKTVDILSEAVTARSRSLDLVIEQDTSKTPPSMLSV